jgi:hypothetical protein
MTDTFRNELQKTNVQQDPASPPPLPVNARPTPAR